MLGDIHTPNINIVSVQLLHLKFQLEDVVDVTKTDVNGHFTPWAINKRNKPSDYPMNSQHKSVYSKKQIMFHKKAFLFFVSINDISNIQRGGCDMWTEHQFPYFFPAHLALQPMIIMHAVPPRMLYSLSTSHCWQGSMSCKSYECLKFLISGGCDGLEMWTDIFTLLQFILNSNSWNH